jgi:hypothetical protein
MGVVSPDSADFCGLVRRNASEEGVTTVISPRLSHDKRRRYFLLTLGYALIDTR